MLPKKNRADRKAIEKIFKEGRFVNSQNLTLKFIKSDFVCPQISFIVPKNIAKLAVKRNYLRRLGYAVLEKHLKELPLITGAFVFKKYQDDISILENEIKTILNKLN